MCVLTRCKIHIRIWMYISKKKREETRPLHFVSYHIYSHAANETHISRAIQMNLSIFTIHHLLVKYTNEILSLFYTHTHDIFLSISHVCARAAFISPKNEQKNEHFLKSVECSLSWCMMKEKWISLDAMQIPLPQQLHIYLLSRCLVFYCLSSILWI